MKKFIKDIFYWIFATNCDDIDIDRYDVVSFDIFDTLIKRNLKCPEDIFDLVEQHYNLKHSHPIENFKSNRIIAEQIARKSCLKEEVTLKEIYCQLDYPCKNELMALECEIEVAVSIPNYCIKSIYRDCLKHHKAICFTSDMYLPIETVKRILQKNGYNQYDRLLLSSHENATKRTGNLFRKIVTEFDISPQRIVHIGDSPRNDYLASKRIGLRAVLIQRNNLIAKFCSDKSPSLEYNLISSFINNTICKHDLDPYSQYGYEVVGPILYSFVNWLHRQFDNNDFKDVFFLARDAKLIMEVFNSKYPKYKNLHYLTVSRKALIAANLYNIDTMEELLQRLQIMIKPTAKVIDLFKAINLRFSDYSNRISHQCDFGNKVIADLTREEKDKIFSLIKPDISKRSKEQHEYLEKYLIQERFDNKVAIVDIGWNGTIQYYLSQTKLQKSDIYGYYYGLNKNKKTYGLPSTLHCDGCLFDRESGLYYQRIIQMSIALFEIAFLSTDCSALAYTIKGNKVVPVYSEPENDIQNVKKIQQIQAGAKLFVSDAIALDYFQIDCPEAFFYNYENFVCHPRLKDLKLFDDIEYFNAGKKRLFQSQSLFFYLFHPKQFYLDLENSSCKIFFMKSFFKIPLPYHKLLNLLYNYKEYKSENLEDKSIGKHDD